jgi:hypothetical protein
MSTAPGGLPQLEDDHGAIVGASAMTGASVTDSIDLASSDSEDSNAMFDDNAVGSQFGVGVDTKQDGEVAMDDCSKPGEGVGANSSAAGVPSLPGVTHVVASSHAEAPLPGASQVPSCDASGATMDPAEFIEMAQWFGNGLHSQPAHQSGSMPRSPGQLQKPSPVRPSPVRPSSELRGEGRTTSCDASTESESESEEWEESEESEESESEESGSAQGSRKRDADGHTEQRPAKRRMVEATPDGAAQGESTVASHDAGIPDVAAAEPFGFFNRARRVALAVGALLRDCIICIRFCYVNASDSVLVRRCAGDVICDCCWCARVCRERPTVDHAERREFR